MAKIRIPFGKTGYDSTIFDNIYRVWSSPNGDTVLAAYYGDEIKVFESKVAIQTINQLLKGGNISAICENYDWKEIRDRYCIWTEVYRRSHDSKLSDQDKFFLSDIVWWLKGYVSAQIEDDKNGFGKEHIDVLIKVINNC